MRARQFKDKDKHLAPENEGWKHNDRYLELKSVLNAQLKQTRFYFCISQNNVLQQIFSCLLSLKEVLHKQHHVTKSSLG